MIGWLVLAYLVGALVTAIPITRYLLSRSIRTGSTVALGHLYLAESFTAMGLVFWVPISGRAPNDAFELLFFIGGIVITGVLAGNAGAAAGSFTPPRDKVSWARTNGLRHAALWPLLVTGVPVVVVGWALVEGLVALSRAVRSIGRATVVPLAANAAGAYARALTGPRGRAEQARYELELEERAAKKHKAEQVVVRRGQAPGRVYYSSPIQ